MGALTQTGHDDPAQSGVTTPARVRTTDPLDLPLGPVPSPPSPPPPPPSDPGRSARFVRSTLATALLVLTVSALAGLALLPVLDRLAERIGAGGRTADTTIGPATVDDRVVVPGRSAGCVTMLVKPLPDGTTVMASGTCFTVG
jgi:hypothetical protein